ncbi:hypothetical protein [Shewanella sp. T24-MNA-CIBAN-0130]|uniref:hypothetical protein n=1 Tax=Shewanella sp. T24-MNA-CIBAN-0130 TaxID=3140470 RepID=UPI00332AFD2E
MDIEELISMRAKELRVCVLGIGMADGYSKKDCYIAAHELIGLPLDDKNKRTLVANGLFSRVGRGTMTLDEAVTRLNDLPIGLQIADMQRQESGESVEDEPLTIDELASEFHAEAAANANEEEMSADVLTAAVRYVEALETHIAQLEDELDTAQGMVFKLNGQVMLLESELKAYQSLT